VDPPKKFDGVPGTYRFPLATSRYSSFMGLTIASAGADAHMELTYFLFRNLNFHPLTSKRNNSTMRIIRLYASL
jgi:hypothetical protein